MRRQNSDGRSEQPPPQGQPEKAETRAKQTPPRHNDHYSQSAYQSYGPYAAAADVYGASADEGTSNELTDLLKLAEIVLKRWHVVLAVIALSAIAMAFYILKATKIYESQALLELRLRRPRIMREDDAVIQDTARLSAGDVFNTQILKFTGPNTRKSVLAKLRAGKAAKDLAELPDKDLLEILRRDTVVGLIRRSSLFNITVQFPDPDLAAVIANTYATALVDNSFRLNKKLSDDAVSWLQTQATSQGELLRETENQLLKFRQENHMEALQAQRRTAVDALIACNDELVRIETQAAVMQDMMDMLDALTSGHETAGRLPSSTPRAEELMATLSGLNDATAHRNAMLTRYTEKHPDVVAQNAVIELMQERLSNEIRRAKETARADLQLLEKQAATLRERKSQQAELGASWEATIAQCKARLTALERKRDATEISYKGILRRMEEARLSADEDTATVEILEQAEPPTKPIKPRRLILACLALFVGSGGGVGLALLKYKLEDRIWHASDITRGMGLRVLGLIPHVGRSGRKDLALASFTDKFSLVAESFGGLRAILDSSETGTTFLTTSSDMEEGKTICSSNLAIVSAKSGLRTLLVDLDMRRPRLGRIWGISDPNWSLLHALCSEAAPDFAALPQKTSVPCLDVIVSHPAQDLSPSEVLGGRRIREFLKWAAEHYERVIVDSPPLGAASDSMVLGGIVDGVVLVCRFNKSKKSAVAAAVRRLQDCGATVLGVVVNDVPAAKTGSGYYSSFDKSYAGYRHGYGRADDDDGDGDATKQTS